MRIKLLARSIHFESRLCGERNPVGSSGEQHIRKHLRCQEKFVTFISVFVYETPLASVSRQFTPE